MADWIIYRGLKFSIGNILPEGIAVKRGNEIYLSSESYGRMLMFKDDVEKLRRVLEEIFVFEAETASEIAFKHFGGGPYVVKDTDGETGDQE